MTINSTIEMKLQRIKTNRKKLSSTFEYSTLTAVAMTHFAVVRSGPPVATGGENIHVVYKISQKS